MAGWQREQGLASYELSKGPGFLNIPLRLEHCRSDNISNPGWPLQPSAEGLNATLLNAVDKNLAVRS